MYRHLMLSAGALLLAAGAAAAPVELKIPQKIDASAPDIGCRSSRRAALQARRTGNGPRDRLGEP